MNVSESSAFNQFWGAGCEILRVFFWVRTPLQLGYVCGAVAEKGKTCGFAQKGPKRTSLQSRFPDCVCVLRVRFRLVFFLDGKSNVQTLQSRFGLEMPHKKKSERTRHSAMCTNTGKMSVFRCFLALAVTPVIYFPAHKAAQHELFINCMNGFFFVCVVVAFGAAGLGLQRPSDLPSKKEQKVEKRFSLPFRG